MNIWDLNAKLGGQANPRMPAVATASTAEVLPDIGRMQVSPGIFSDFAVKSEIEEGSTQAQIHSEIIQAGNAAIETEDLGIALSHLDELVSAELAEDANFDADELISSLLGPEDDIIAASNPSDGTPEVINTPADGSDQATNQALVVSAVAVSQMEPDSNSLVLVPSGSDHKPAKLESAGMDLLVPPPPHRTGSNAMPFLTARNALERREWTADEDDLIRNGVAAWGNRWRRIAEQLPGRSDDAVRNRWSRLRTEANLERCASKDLGDRSNADTGVTGAPIPAPAVLRRGTSDEPVNISREVRVSWSPSEDAIIVNSVREFGHRWYQIAQRLPHRTDHAIRNRYQRLLKMAEEQPILTSGPDVTKFTSFPAHLIR